MAEFTIEQQRALARARARLRLQQGQSQQAPQSTMSGAEDIARSAATGVGEGVSGTVGLLGDVQSLADDFGTAVGDFFGLSPLTPEQEAVFKRDNAPTTAAIESATGLDQHKHTPQTTAGKYARTVGQFTPAAALGGARAILPYGVVPGAVSEAAGQATEGTPLETPARIAGGIAGAGAGTGIRRLVTPRNIPQQNVDAANVLRQEGITGLTEGQITQSKRVQAAERQRLGPQGDARRVEQFEQLTAASLRRAGINGNRATPDVVDQGFRDIGNEFERLATNNTMRLDGQFSQDLLNAMDDYHSIVNPSQASPIVENTVNDVIRVMQRSPGNPTLPGNAYQSTRSRLERLARNTRDPELQRALRDLREAFDNAMERSIRPQDAGAWRDVRNRYRNMLVVEDAVTVAGPESALGLITPPALNSAWKRLHGKRNAARGQGDFADLSRAASGVMTELPLTGAAPLRSGRGVFDAGVLSPLDWLARTVNRARMSAPVQRYLTNRLMPAPPNASPMRNFTPAVIPPFTDIMRDRNGIPVLDPSGQRQPAR